MEINFMLLASPLFLLLIALECIISVYKKNSIYPLNDSINNFSSGILEEIASLPIKGLIIIGYYYLYENHAFYHFNPNSIWTWFLLLIGVDFGYYWFHRTSHRNNFFWIGHSVHHQSERYNFVVALRQGYFQTLTSWVFYLPLALLGFPTWMYLTLRSIDSVYQFCLHTQAIKHLGWFEKVFNTPSHHRVHHGKNPEYIDKNYGGILIIWDKIFGTFEPEIAPVEYGVTEPLDLWDPFYANVKVINDLFYYGKSLKSKFNLFRAFFMPPEWILKKLEQEGATITKRTRTKIEVALPKLYMLYNTLVTLCLYIHLSMIFKMDSLVSWIIGSLIMITLYLLGRITSGGNKIQRFEFIRAFLVFVTLWLSSNALIFSIFIGLLFYASNYLLYYPLPHLPLSRKWVNEVSNIN